MSTKTITIFKFLSVLTTKIFFIKTPV